MKLSEESLTEKEKYQLRNAITALIARTRKVVEVANFEDRVSSIKQKFDSLARILDRSLSKKCQKEFS